MSKSKLLRQWEDARDDLGIEIVAPYDVEIQTGERIRAELLVKHFGHGKGTLILTETDEVWPFRQQLVLCGYGYSVLDEPTTEADEHYDREQFIELLSEWEWTGLEGKKPEWLRRPPD